MGCLLVFFAAAAPRLTLVILWIFTDLVDRAYSGFLVPLLGLLVLPYTTLFYVLAWSPIGGVSGGGWAFVTLGFVFDIAHTVGGRYVRR